MAYNLRLTIEGSDILENNVAINVYQEGFTGSAVTRNGAGNVFEIDWGSKSGELLPVVYGSEATVRFFAENDYEFLDLFATTARDLKVEIILNETDTIWAGFIEPEKWSEPLISPNYEVQFTAYDGLGLLKDEDFANTDKTPYEGEATPLEILQLILSKTGLELPLNTKVNIRPSTAITAIDSLTQTRINQSSYTGQTCYEVLESLFLNCRLKQRGGEWYIISHDEWSAAATTITWYSYTAAGAANGTKQTDKYFTGFWFENQASLEIMPAVKQLQITHNYGYKQNLLLNGDFQEFNAATGFDAWTVVGGFTPQQRQYDPDGNKFVYLPGIERLDPWDSANRTKYMVSEAITVSQASDVFNIHLDYALMGPVKNSGYVFFGTFLEGDNGIDYALEAYYYTETDIREVRYRWTANSHKLAVPVKAHIKRNRVFLGADTFEVEPDRIEAYPYDDVMNHFATAQIAVEGGIPTSGTLQIYLFLAHTGGTVAGNCFRKIRLFLTDEEGEEFPTQTDYTLINSLRNNYVPQETTVFNGDLPPLDNALTIYTTGFIHNGGLTDGDPTTLWKLDTDAAVYTWVELMARMMAAQIRIPKQSYQVRLGDTTPGTAMLFEDDDNPGKIFIEAGVKYDFRMATTEGRYVELIPINLSPYTLVENAETTGGTTGGTTRPTPGENLNTDERSKLIDPVTYDIEGQAGYLSSEDFEQEIDETTGRAVNSIRYHKAQIFDPITPEFVGAPGFLHNEDFTFEVDVNSGFTLFKVNTSSSNISELINNLAIQIFNNGIASQKESFLIDDYIGTTYTQLSSWFVVAPNENVGNFKATVMVHDKVDNSIFSLQNTLTFDYKDPLNEVSDDNEIITSTPVTLTLGIDSNKQLYATLSGMHVTDNERIHFCFERCANNTQAPLTLDHVSGEGTIHEPTLENEATLELEHLEGEGTVHEVTAEEVDPWADAFITEWNMPSGDFILPLPSGESYNMEVDWGDGSPISTVTSYNDANATHTYLSTATVQLKIKGKCGGWQIGNKAAIKLLITKVIQWGNVGFENLSYAFWGSANLTELPIGSITGATGVDSITYMFANTGITEIPTGLFDLMTPTHLGGTFSGTPIKAIPTGLLDTCYGAMIFQNCFAICLDLESIPTGLFDMCILATGFAYVFYNDSGLTSIPENLYDNCPNVTQFTGAHYGNSGVISNVPDLWNSHPTAVGTTCFRNCNNAANYASIPAGWK